MATGAGTRAIVAAFFANLGIAIAKFVGFLITSSSSMLAESVHSLADTANQGLLMLGGRRARRPANEVHPFGYGRERYFWSFIVALMLFSLGSAFALFEGVEKIRHPHEIESPAVAVGILVVAIVLETFSFRTAIVESRPLKGTRSWSQFIRTARVPELPVVLLEDFGALVGLIIALTAIGITSATDDAVWDGIGTLSIGVLLGVIAIVLAVEMKSLLIGESAQSEDIDAIRRAILGTGGVDSILNLRTLHIGPEEILVTAKVAFNDALTAGQLATAVNGAEERVRAVVPSATVVYLEHDTAR